MHTGPTALPRPIIANSDRSVRKNTIYSAYVLIDDDENYSSPGRRIITAIDHIPPASVGWLVGSANKDGLMKAVCYTDPPRGCRLPDIR